MHDEWINVGSVADVDEDDTHSVEVDGKRVCLYKLGGEIYATDGTCTHGEADLSLGMVVNSCLIECPLHEGTFDIRTGRAVDAPCTEPLHCYPVKVEQGVIYLRPVR
ncbi:ferredoxin [Hydrogenophaga sp. Root209]|jgi:nitrite reductase/ring-hydroxylating ferredoxin subunit|uniref:Ferredoxin n=1 Tax=Hydrogenophaga electricum TaxID=1230953 RepID=A0ABQ6C0N6_9BURK|nr:MULTISPECIES: non-heme iron oxygenase ferredoxin subunit [Hydrogenophaga]KRB96190.1 ferredoxin [Hydrogenophaga sp. Root209]GLS13948.1 ferredoxin [Hydrogenophaga electricum]